MRIISGETGASDIELGDDVFQRDQVQFELFMLDVTGEVARDAQQAANWETKPTLQVTGADGTRVAVQGTREDPLIIFYTFRYEGTKRIRIYGTPRAVSLPTRTRHHRGAEQVELFDELDLRASMRVRRLSAGGEAAATTAGSHGRAVQDREQAVDIETRRRSASERERRERERAVRDEYREEQEDIRESSGTRRRGLLVFPMRSQRDVMRMDVEEAAEEAARLQGAIDATPVLDLNPSPWRPSPTDYRVSTRRTWGWSASGRNHVVFYQVPHVTGVAEGGRRRTVAPGERERVRRETVISFRRDEWIVVRLPGRSRALMQASDALLNLRIDELLDFLQFVDNVSDFFGVIVPAARLATSLFLQSMRFLAEQAMSRAGRYVLTRRGARALRAEVAHAARQGTSRTTSRPMRALPGRPRRPRRPGVDRRGRGGSGRPQRPIRSGDVAPRPSGAARVPYLRAGRSLRLPELRGSGLSIRSIRVLGRILNRPFSTAEMAAFRGLWTQARRSHLQAIRLLQQVIGGGATSRRVIGRRARAIFDRIRNDFWRNVENNPHARQVLLEAGVQFPGNGRSPFINLTMPDGRTLRATIDVDHIAELGRSPLRAFSPSNLRFTFQRENRILLNQLHSQDSFLPDLRRTAGRGMSRGGRLRGPLMLPPPGGSPVDGPDYGAILDALEAIGE